MANKISVLIDVATDKAVSGLKGFKQSINDADGAVGKMKVAATGAFDQIKAHAGQMALAAGASLVAFGVKAVGAFTDLALEAGRFSEVTGLAVEDASRWIEVGTSIGVTAGTMETAFGKLNVEIGKGGAALKEFGIDIVLAKDGTVDANATFLNAIETIKGIQDPTKKAQAAQAAFGRGWKEMAELINIGADGLVTKMGEVSDAQVIDQAELGKARDLRESMDKLKDSIGDVALTVGEELTPAVSVAAEMLAGIAPIAGDMAGFVGDQFVKIAEEAYEFGSTLADIADLIPGINMSEPIAETLFEQEKLERGTADLVAEFAKGAPTMEEFVAKLKAAGTNEHAMNLAIIEYRSQLEGANTVTGDAVEAIDELALSTDTSTLAHWDAKESIDAVKRADEEAEDAAREHAEALRDLIAEMINAVGGAFDLEQATLNLDSAYATYQESILTTMGVLADSEVSDRDKEQALRDLRTQELGVAGDALATAEAYADEMGAVDGSRESAQLQKDKLRELQAAYPELRDEIQLYIDKLNSIPTVVDTQVRVNIPTGATAGVQGPIRATLGLASGTSNWGGGVALLGERGPELAYLPAGAQVFPASQTVQMLAAGGGGPPVESYTANVYTTGEVEVADISRAFTLVKLSR